MGTFFNNLNEIRNTVKRFLNREKIDEESQESFATYVVNLCCDFLTTRVGLPSFRSLQPPPNNEEKAGGGGGDRKVTKDTHTTISWKHIKHEQLDRETHPQHLSQKDTVKSPPFPLHRQAFLG